MKARVVGTSEEELKRNYSCFRLGDCASRCETLNSAGCTLAWLVVHAEGIYKCTGSPKIWDIIFTSGVWRQTGRKRLVFPMKLGGLETLWKKFGSLSLDAATEEEFANEHALEAWMIVVVIALNMMYGFRQAPESGSWSKAELKAVEAIGSSIRRLLSHGTTKRPYLVSEEKELLKKRVNYQGEEVGVCHPLSLEQVLSALPPPEHGGSIACVDFVSPQTKDWLLNPGR